MTTREKGWMFIGFEMYYKGLSKEELDSLTSLEFLMEMDDFDRWIAKGMPES